MLKFPLADCDAIDEWSPRSFQSALAAKQEVYSLFFESCLDTRLQIGLIGVAKILSFSNDIQVLKNVYFLLSSLTKPKHLKVCSDHVSVAVHQLQADRGDAQAQPGGSFQL